MAHTILLVQPTPRPESRTWSDYESINDCMEGGDVSAVAPSSGEGPSSPSLFVSSTIVVLIGICKIFEEHLKKQNPNSPSITYDVSQLFDFIDRLADLSCLVFQKSTSNYVPHNKDWIKAWD